MGLPNKRTNSGSEAPTLEWIKSNCDTSGDCWVWLGSKDRKGYGRVTRRTGALRIHRLALELSGVSLVPGKVVDHLCRNTSCCRPDHLEQVTTRENTRRGTSVLHVDGVCHRCGCTNLKRRKWGHYCPDCLKNYEATESRMKAKLAYEQKRAADPARREKQREYRRRYAERKRLERVAAK